ncbi:MAG: hypothetical protein ABI886_13165 [Betaproteobacteria bacterium]
MAPQMFPIPDIGNAGSIEARRFYPSTNETMFGMVLKRVDR